MRFSTLLAPSLFTAALLALAGCPAPAGGGAAASVGDGLCAAPADTTASIKTAGAFSVSELEFDAELLSIPARARGRYDNEKGRDDIAERILLNKAMFASAKEAGILDDPKVQLSARMAAEKAYVAALMSKVEADSASDAAVQAYYDENTDKYQRPMVRARHILVKEEALANDLFAQLKGGADFAALAKEHSTDRGSKPKGGELPWATKDRWVPEFAEAAFTQAIGSAGAPVKSKFGYHIIEVLEKRDMQPLEEVRPGIERVLTRNAVREYRDGVKSELGLAKTKPAPSVRPPAGARPGKGDAAGADVKAADGEAAPAAAGKKGADGSK